MAFSLDQFYRLNRRALIWIILLVMIWMMRNFFSLIFLTFIMAFIAIPLAGVAQRRLHMSRRFSIVVVYLCFLLALGSFASFVTPRAIKEANILLRDLPQTQEKVIDLKKSLVARYPSINPLLMGYVRSVLPENEMRGIHAELISFATQLAGPPSLPNAITPPPSVSQPPAGAKALAPDDDDATLESVMSSPVYKAKEDELLANAVTSKLADDLRKQVPTLIKFLWRLSGTLLLALLFSFLVIMDIARLSEEIKSLRASRLHDFYEQAAQPVVRFAYVLGRAFQAQAAIACTNATLTFLGLMLLGIPSLAMLTLIVFICSFIPVLGVFISTVPILLVAINSGGLTMALAVIGLVIVIHAIEAYLLNPIIYGKHLKLNPVIVLMILFVGHHAFGLWGMLLGVPVAYYFIHDVFGVPVWGERKLTAPPGKSLGGMPPHDVEKPPRPAETPEAPAHVGAKE